MESPKKFKRLTLSNNMTVVFIPKEYYNHYLCSVSFNFGAYSVSCELHDVNYDLPLGIAHFLEHMIFSSNERVFQEFTSHGLELNAYTSPTHTSYTVEGTENIVNTVRKVIELISEVELDINQIEVEKNLIKDEIELYDNDPDEKIFRKIILEMIESSYLHYDVCGTPESLEKMDKDILSLVYKHFYTPQNMLLTIIGAFETIDEEKIISQLSNLKFNLTNKTAKKTNGKALIKNYSREFITNSGFPVLVLLSKIERNQRLYYEIYLELILRLLSDCDKFKDLSYDIDFYEDIVVSSLFFSSREEYICKESIIKNMNEISDKDIHFAKNSILLDFLLENDNIDEIQYRIADYWTYGINYYDFINIIDSIDKESILEVVNQHFIKGIQEKKDPVNN